MEAMVAEFAARRKLMVEGLAAIPGIRCRVPEGAFYAFPSVEGLLGKRHGDAVLADDMAVAAFLLDEARCAVVPGAAFGAPGYVRLSYAASQAQIREGVSRIAAAVAKLG
jgi:aspartate aminotransferase